MLKTKLNEYLRNITDTNFKELEIYLHEENISFFDTPDLKRRAIWAGKHFEEVVNDEKNPESLFQYLKSVYTSYYDKPDFFS